MRHDDSVDLKSNGNEQVEKVKEGRGKWGKDAPKAVRQTGRQAGRKCKSNWVSPASAIDGQNRYTHIHIYGIN